MNTWMGQEVCGRLGFVVEGLRDGQSRWGRTITYCPPQSRANATKPLHDCAAQWFANGTVGYIRIPSFHVPSVEEKALDCVKEFARATTMIIDLRSNGGGITPSKLIDALMERPYRWWTETAVNIGHLWKRHQGHGEFSILQDGSGAVCRSDWTEPNGSIYSGRVILLTDRYCGSAAEDFIMPFKDTKRGILIGETTWGSTGQPVCFECDGISIGIGSVRASFPDAGTFEGVGITPDIAVMRSRDDLYDGRDVVLAKALEIAQV
ncbi:hypothetical protein JI721_14110 [Alicyclobacillus cycloheptanicus]|nr:hypothetical protein JI721_14110 [Alicyclobacillus cycloheptanicus]